MGRAVDVKALGHAFLEELVEAFAETLELGRARVVQIDKTLWRERGDFVEKHPVLLAQSISDAEVMVAYDADDVTGVGFVNRLAILGKEPLGIGKAKLLSATWVADHHIALELTRNNSDKCDMVPVFRIHVRLDLEDETGKFRVLWGDGFSQTPASRGAWRKF